MSMKCSEHKSYKALRRPRTDCPRCYQIYAAKHPDRVMNDKVERPAPPGQPVIVQTPEPPPAPPEAPQPQPPVENTLPDGSLVEG